MAMTDMKDTASLKVALLSFAHMHAHSYANILSDLPGVEISHIWDANEERGQTAADRYHTTFITDYELALRDESVDAVVICSENANHKEMVLAAAEAGKHILCEKPIATSVEDGWEMLRACEQRGVLFQTAFPIRFSTPIQTVKNQIDAGDIGRIVAMNGTNRGQNPGGWFVDKALSGGGAVLDHTVHVLDIMRWYVGSEVTEVYAEVDSRFGSEGIDDCGLLTMQFENGVIAAHDPSWSRPKTFPTWGDVTLRLIGTGGVIDVDAFRQHLTRYDDKAGNVKHVMWGDDADYKMVSSFIDCVRTGSEPVATGLDGLKAMEVALAAYESGRTGKPVKLSHGR